METLLTPEDSARVADALIAKIEDADFDVAFAVKKEFQKLLKPTGYYEDWLPLVIGQMCSDIRRDVRTGGHK
jgi:hypothetical protein